MSGHSALKVSEKSRQIYNAKRKKVINNRKIYICKREPVVKTEKQKDKSDRKSFI